jgi:hypothetical protein
MAEKEYSSDEDDPWLALVHTISTRIETLSEAALHEEADFDDGHLSLFFQCVSWRLPLTVIARLIDAGGADIDAQVDDGDTAIMEAAYFGFADIVNYLANRKADLSINNDDGFNVYTTIETNANTSKEMKSAVYHVLAEHGVTGSDIREGFRSTLNASTALIPPPKRLAHETVNNVRF